MDQGLLKGIDPQHQDTTNSGSEGESTRTLDMDLSPGTRKPSPWVVVAILAVTIVGFTVQTEATAYYQEVLGWPKPFTSLYLTHSSLIFPWLVYQLLSPTHPITKPAPWLTRQIQELAALSATTDEFSSGARPESKPAALNYMLRTTAILTAVLTISGVSWFSALAWTTPSDLTVIYNCSAFFAAIFSVPLLQQRLTRNIMVAVALSFLGTLLIAYGSGSAGEQSDGIASVGTARVFGNMIAVVGACAYGLYCVLFKKWTTSSRQNDPLSSMKMTFASSGLTGAYTLSLFWLALLVLHFTGVETISLPSAQVCFFLLISVIPGSISMTSVLVLTAWTNPIFGSVASILCVFFIAMADWLLFRVLPTGLTYLGGALIFFAFGLLSWDESAK